MHAHIYALTNTTHRTSPDPFQIQRHPLHRPGHRGLGAATLHHLEITATATAAAAAAPTAASGVGAATAGGCWGRKGAGRGGGWGWRERVV